MNRLRAHLRFALSCTGGLRDTHDRIGHDDVRNGACWRRRCCTRACSTGAVLLVAHVLLPVDDLSVDVLLNCNVRHRARRCSTVPVLHSRRGPNDIAGSQLPLRSAPLLSPTAARRDDQRLARGMRVPGGGVGASCRRLLERVARWQSQGGACDGLKGVHGQRRVGTRHDGASTNCARGRAAPGARAGLLARHRRPYARLVVPSTRGAHARRAR